MGPKSALAAVLVAASLGACRSEHEQGRLEGTAAMRSGEQIRAAAIERAIVAQRTLYSYHFEIGSPELNELGRRDLGVLARHLTQAGGRIVLARGEADEGLYRTRAERVLAALKEAGVPPERAKLAEGLPGGDGMSGARLVEILERAAAPLADAPTAGAALATGGAVK
jgi:hypothetical protein